MKKSLVAEDSYIFPFSFGLFTYILTPSLKSFFKIKLNSSVGYDNINNRCLSLFLLGC